MGGAPPAGCRGNGRVAYVRARCTSLACPRPPADAAPPLPADVLLDLGTMQELDWRVPQMVMPAMAPQMAAAPAQPVAMPQQPAAMPPPQ